MRQENKSGFFAVHRQITEWRWWHNNTARGIWLYLLTEANWKDGFLRNGELIPRGSLARSLRKMAEDSGVTVNTLRYWLERFARTGEITKTTTQGYTVINIVNYDKYQSFLSDGYKKGGRVLHILLLYLYLYFIRTYSTLLSPCSRLFQQVLPTN